MIAVIFQIIGFVVVTYFAFVFFQSKASKKKGNKENKPIKEVYSKEIEDLKQIKEAIDEFIKNLADEK